MRNAKIKEVPVISVCVRKKLTLLTDTVTAVFKSRRNGITLIELVIGMVLMGIVALVVANALSTGVKGNLVTDNRKEGLDQARVAMERMTREIRNLRSSSDISAATATTFTFVDTSGASISFALSVGNLNRNADTLATGISNNPPLSGIFKYVLTDGSEIEDATGSLTLIKRIKIDFKATAGTESVSLQSEVWPRNLVI